MHVFEVDLYGCVGESGPRDVDAETTCATFVDAEWKSGGVEDVCAKLDVVND